MTNDRRETTKLELLECAAGLIAQSGYHGMSMRELARSAERSLASLYTYFSSKDEVLLALQVRAFHTLLSTVDDALKPADEAASRLYCFILHHVRYVVSHRAVMRVLVQEAGTLSPSHRHVVRDLKERYFTVASGVIAEVLAKGCSNKKVAPTGPVEPAEFERITYNLFGMLNWTYGWYDAERHGDAHALARTVHDLVMCGLVTQCPHRPAQRTMERHMSDIVVPTMLKRTVDA